MARACPGQPITVFYRTNAQSRMLEDMLMRAGVPYRLVGGTRFFDRAEIRDVTAYLNLVVNPANDVAHRVINVPKRGIGKTTVEHIDYVARETGITFLQAAELALPTTRFALPRARPSRNSWRLSTRRKATRAICARWLKPS